MTTEIQPSGDPRDCNCFALRRAARCASRLYDGHLAPSGLRTTQFTILATLENMGALTISALAEILSMDRTTAGKNILPLQRSGLIQIAASDADARRREACITREGRSRLQVAQPLWNKAQVAFEERHGVKRARRLRATLQSVARSIGP